MAASKSNRQNEMADELDAVASLITGARGRKLQRIAAELRGEEVEPTAQELRDQERAAARAEQAQREAEAAQAAAEAAKAATEGGQQS